MVSYGFGQNSFNFVRYNASTGETFYGKGENLVKYTDDVPPPAGDYEVQVVVQNTTTVPVRLETISGRVWYASGGKWIEMKVAPPAPQPK